MAEPLDPTAALKAQLEETRALAERLAAEASGARSGWTQGRVPPAGWATPEEHAARTDDVQALAALLRTLRTLVPAELEGQVREVLRQVLLLLRAVVDWWVERIEAGPETTGSAERSRTVQDIPVD